MKPNEFKISTVLWIVILIMLIRIPNSQSHSNKFCGRLTIYNKLSTRYLNINNRTKSIAADSGEKHYLYSISKDRSLRFFLYDPNADLFICVKKNKPKLVHRRMPESRLCLFQEKPITETSYIMYFQSETNYTMSFTKGGKQQPVPHRLRHRHQPKHQPLWKKDSEAFLQNKVYLDEDECGSLSKDFCTKMQMRSRKKHKLPNEIRTFCKFK